MTDKQSTADDQAPGKSTGDTMDRMAVDSRVQSGAVHAGVSVESIKNATTVDGQKSTSMNDLSSLRKDSKNSHKEDPKSMHKPANDGGKFGGGMLGKRLSFGGVMNEQCCPKNLVSRSGRVIKPKAARD